MVRYTFMHSRSQWQALNKGLGDAQPRNMREVIMCAKGWQVISEVIW